ncbi:MAG: formylglycine-generating enzyme family protein, partial [Proteobacteria bacterium]|nr:formylglycine-generating enzyme family protein [Pseudomonadota bacterium]
IDARYGVYADLHIETRHARASQRLRWIEPGSFRMGSPDNEPGRYDNEGPQHPVTLTRGFWLADTACTQALWQAVTGGNPSRFEDDPQNPVERVSWNDVQIFLRALEGLLPGAEACLPNEAQWEYACRAGTDTPFSFGAQITSAQVNYDGNFPYAGGSKGEYRGRTVPVKSLPANDWGLYEMHGNVWEWCADGLRTYDEAPQQDPEGPAGSAQRAVRGGSWIGVAGGARSACRGAGGPGVAGGFLDGLGFRLCLRSSGQVWPGGPSGARRPEGDLPPAPVRDAPGASRAQRATDFFSRPGKSGGKRKK